MPEAVRYYPVIARILTMLGNKSVVSYRASVISLPGPFVASAPLIDRFLMEYKGATYSCDANNEQYVTFYYSQIQDYLSGKIRKQRDFDEKILQPNVVIQIDLREIKPMLVG
jgi:hypothetical protein